MDDFPLPREVISRMMASRNATGRSFHLTYDSDLNVDGMSGGTVYIGTVPHSVGRGSTDGAAIVVTKTRCDSTIGGDTTYSVSMGSDSSKSTEEGLTSVYVIPITTGREDNRDMVCYADITDDSDIEDTDIDPYKSDPSHSGSPPDGGPTYNSNSVSGSSLDYCGCDVAQYEKDCSRVLNEINQLKTELESIGIYPSSEWQEHPSDGKIYHVKGYSQHLAGTGGSDCPLCNPGEND